MRNSNSKVFEVAPKHQSHTSPQIFVPRYVPTDEEINGRLVRSMKIGLCDMSKPKTPQSGNDVHVGDLSYDIRHGLAIEHKPAYLSLLGRNPYSQEVFSTRLASEFENSISKFVESEINSKEDSKED